MVFDSSNKRKQDVRCGTDIEADLGISQPGNEGMVSEDRDAVLDSKSVKLRNRVIDRFGPFQLAGVWGADQSSGASDGERVLERLSGKLPLVVRQAECSHARPGMTRREHGKTLRFLDRSRTIRRDHQSDLDSSSG